jgi:hypothetical protein
MVAFPSLPGRNLAKPWDLLPVGVHAIKEPNIPLAPCWCLWSMSNPLKSDGLEASSTQTHTAADGLVKVSAGIITRVLDIWSSPGRKRYAVGLHKQCTSVVAIALLQEEAPMVPLAALAPL